jgi:hypothetical protein
MTAVKKRTALWAAGGIALAGGSIALGITVSWGAAAIVGGLLETAYFGLLPLGLNRRRDQRRRSQAPAEAVPVTLAATEAKAETADRLPAAAPLDFDPPPPPPSTAWNEELSAVLESLVLCLPDPVDIGQIAVQCGIPSHLIERSGDRAVNRWQELINRAFLEGGDKRIDLVFTRAMRRSGQDPRLVAAVTRWRQAAAPTITE